MRVSTNLFFSNILTSIQKEYLGGARTQEQIATGQRINRLGDDPLALSHILSLRASKNEIRDYVSSIDQQMSRLNRAEEALAQASEVMQDARQIAVQGGTATHSVSDLKNLAFEVDQMINALVGFANASRGGIKPEGLFTREGDRVIYHPPASWDGMIAGEGWGRVLTLNMLVETIDPGNVFQVQADGVDEEGNTVWRATMFDTLFSLRNMLLEGKQDEVTRLSRELEAHVEHLVQGRSDAGSRGYHLEKVRGQIQIQNEQLTEILSKIGDTDVAEAVIKLNRHELVLQATLSTSARLMQISLLHHLR